MRYEDLRRMVARRVQTLRERRDWNQRTLQQKSGVSHKSVSNVEATDSAIQLDTLHALAVSLGMEPWELLKPGADELGTSDHRGKYEVDPRLRIVKEAPSGLKALAADEGTATTLNITSGEWQLLEGVADVLPPTVDKAGYVQLLFTLRAICR